MSRPAEICIDLAALRSNLSLAQSLCPSSKTIAVVKADAYGHGAIDIASALVEQADMFAVSCLEEALELRESGILAPVLLLEGCFSADEYAVAAAQGFELVTHNQEQIELLEQSHLTHRVRAWLKVDSGMHRLGVPPTKAMACFSRLQNNPLVEKVVLMTHLASADSADPAFTEGQLANFQTVLTQLANEPSLELSIANSAGVLGWPETRSDWNRPGIMLYGLTPFDFSHPQGDKLTPVMTFTSQVIALRTIDVGECVGYGNTWQATRKSKIATVAVGYGDGYPRNAKSGTPVLVKGKKAQLAGRVSMDMITLDVTDVSGVCIGDEVELWGKSLSANEVASWADTIGYELVTRMPKRTRRTFLE